ncbi:CaiB/BaiF CoA transferase family protein [Tateyamaria sp.]|jgi:crotonobetainyl-CoA:carnitine CoA-transferase CaiB-like acyl-CoA transferase|uniref:CaiB/BaiF CoA transferase family protein n=1 Tax=Tateyamaria sp. TaxID=1929288 RepID=UPI0032DDFFFC
MAELQAKPPLAGVRVLEFGQIAAGPFAGSLLADLGADVVKVERPDGGDGMRSWPPLTDNGAGDLYSENFASLNRNKRSITANLKDPEDLARLKRLAAECDVIVENYRPGVLDRLGLGYDALSADNSALVYCSISGYGQTGPYHKKGAFDVTVQGMSGLMSVTGEKGGVPVKAGVPVGDFCAGLYAGYTILAKLMQARETGQGGHIDCSMLGSLLGVAALQTSQYFGTGEAPEALGSAHPRNAPYRAFQASDAPFIIAAGNDKLWEQVAHAVGLPHLIEDPRFATQLLRAENQDGLFDLLQPEFEKQTAEYWLTEMDKRGVPCSPINAYPEVFEGEQVKHMNLVRSVTLPNGQETRTTAFPIQMTGYDFEIFRDPPKLGAHNDDVVADWLSAEDLR